MHTQGTATPAAAAPSHTPAWVELRRRRRAELRARLSDLFDASVLLGAVAGLLSFIHIRDVAEMGGQTGWAGWFYPLIVDTITVSAYAALKRCRATGENASLPWTLLIMGTAASLTANIVDAVMHAPAGASTQRLALCVAVGTWPAVAFFGAMLLRHGGKPADQPTAIADQPATEPAAPAPTEAPQRTPDRPAAPIVRPADRAAAAPPPIPVRPTDQPDAWAHLGPRAASTGELQGAAWVKIGHPVYQHLRSSTGDRPTETALQQALGDHVQALIDRGTLPPAVGRPSLSTVKRIRSAIETAHPELKQVTARPRMTAITA